MCWRAGQLPKSKSSWKAQRLLDLERGGYQTWSRKEKMFGECSSYQGAKTLKKCNDCQRPKNVWGARCLLCREKKRLRGNNSCWRVQKLRECGGQWEQKMLKHAATPREQKEMSGNCSGCQEKRCSEAMVAAGEKKGLKCTEARRAGWLPKSKKACIGLEGVTK